MTPTPARPAPDAIVSDAARANIFHRRLVAAVGEAEAVLASTPYSSSVAEAQDFAAAIYSDRMELLAQSRRASGTFVGTLGRGLRSVLAHVAPETLEPGDAGELNRDVMAFIEANSRLPRQVGGDARSLSDDPVDFIVGTVDRIDHAPFGLAGGHPGSGGSLTIDGQPVDRRRAQPMLPGQTVTAKLPGGGGFGPVSERDRRLVELDITCGYVTDGVARDVYGYSARAAPDVGTANWAANRPVRYSKEEVAVGCDPAARYHRPVRTSGE